jgi:hypothetical protein
MKTEKGREIGRIFDYSYCPFIFRDLPRFLSKWSVEKKCNKERRKKKNMKNKIVGIVVLMLVATSVVSATNINMKENDNKIVNSEPSEPGLFDWWNVDQKQTHQDGRGTPLISDLTGAQSFTPTKDKLTAVSLYFFKHGTPAELTHITVSIRDNLTSSDLVNTTIDTSVVTIKSSGTWVLFDFEDIPITPGSLYFIVCSVDIGTQTNCYCWFFSDNDTYPQGEYWLKESGSSDWTMYSGGDFCFKTYFRKPLDVSSAPQTIPNTLLTGMKMIDTTVPAVISVKNSVINASVQSAPQTCGAGDWSEVQKLLASDGVEESYFGGQICLDGDTVLIGAPGDDDNGHWSGSVYVFIWDGASWTEQAKLLPSDGGAVDAQFGGYLDMDGDTAVIGAMWDDDNGLHSGSAYVFTRNSTTWTEQQKLLPADGVVDMQFGISVDLDGDTLLIGANRDDDNGIRSGSAYVYTRSGTTWTQQAKLIASDGAEEERFGIDVALEGDTAMIGSETPDNGDNSGSVYVFTRTGTTWTEQQKLLASDGAAVDWFGFYIALDGDTALFAASQDDDKGSNSGSVYVFTRVGSTWTEQQKLTASDGAANDHFSENAIALDGDTAIIGAYLDDDLGSASGSAYVFTRTGTTWTEQQKLTASDGAATDWFSLYGVALDGDTAFIGALWDDNVNGVDAGSAYVFTKSGADITFNISGGLGVKVDITNNGTSDANDIPWQIHVEGGMLGMINKTVNGTVDIPAGESVTVNTGMLLGFGALSITAKVADEEQTATGTQIIIFSMVK